MSPRKTLKISLANKQARLPNGKTQKGMVLLMVLMVFALAAVVSSELSFRSFREIYRTSNIIYSNETYMLARGGEAFAVQKLIADFEYDQLSGLNADYLTEAWATESAPLAVDTRSENDLALETGQFVGDDFLGSAKEKEQAEQLDIGELTIIIEDLQALFNVNNVLYEVPGKTKGDELLKTLLTEVLQKGPQSPQFSGDELFENELDQAEAGDLEDDFFNGSANNSLNGVQQLNIVPQDLMLAFRDWVDGDKDSALVTGAEDDFYSQRTPPYLPSNRYLINITELRAIKGFNQEGVYQLFIPELLSEPQETSASDDESGELAGEAEDNDSGYFDPNGSFVSQNIVPTAQTQWGGVKHFFTALPFGSKINVNTAHVEVLTTIFGPADAQIIVEKRTDSPYQQVNDVFTNLPRIKQADWGQYTDLLSVNSQYFLVTVIATIEETSFTLQSKIHRREDGEIRVISRDFSL